MTVRHNASVYYIIFITIILDRILGFATNACTGFVLFQFAFSGSVSTQCVIQIRFFLIKLWNQTLQNNNKWVTPCIYHLWKSTISHFIEKKYIVHKVHTHRLQSNRNECRKGKSHTACSLISFFFYIIFNRKYRY